jgi:cytosine deaminase
LIRQFGFRTVIVGESRTFAGGLAWLRECGVRVIDLDSAECAAMMRDYIAGNPEVWNEDIGEE